MEEFIALALFLSRKKANFAGLRGFVRLGSFPEDGGKGRPLRVEEKFSPWAGNADNAEEAGRTALKRPAPGQVRKPGVQKMESARKITAAEMTAGLRQEEVCRILNLKQNLDYSEVLVNYTARYQALGWSMAAVNTTGEADLELDFSQPQEVWSGRLADLGFKGIQVNLGVRTGRPSRLLVLEVGRGQGEAALDGLGPWRSGWVAQLGVDREAHYYTLQAWEPAPPACFLDRHQVMVFGEGGLVLAPPSVEPRAREPLRWLKAPWESPPSPVSPGLWDFLLAESPGDLACTGEPGPDLPAWDDIYLAVLPHPDILKALLAPAATCQEYYQRLLEAALKAGLGDSPILLGLLWHAPLGEARRRPGGLEFLQGLVQAAPAIQVREETRRVAGLTRDLQAGADLLREGLSRLGEGYAPEAGAAAATAPGAASGKTSKAAGSEMQTQPGPLPPEPKAGPPPPAAPRARGLTQTGALSPGVSSGSPARSGSSTRGLFPGETGMSLEARPPREMPGAPAPSREPGTASAQPQFYWIPGDSLLVERRRYESMLYQLGRLEALHELERRCLRENKALKDKMDLERREELANLRRLVTQKKEKGWWK